MARLRIVLDEKNDEQGSTWVVSVPVDRQPLTEWSVWRAIDEAAKVMKMNVARDFEAVERAPNAR